MWLLEDEEYPSECCTQTNADEVAKAQLKKVVENLKAYCVFQGNMQLDFEMGENNWRQLLKEIE